MPVTRPDDEEEGRHLDRREFLLTFASLTGGLLAGSRGGGSVAPRVTASTTVFFAQPDGRNSLVRFVVEGSPAPAGRLRVFDRARKLVGTAGVIGFGGRLYGELWMSLDRETEISTELEVPGVTGILRTAHRVSPSRRWTIYWITLADNPIVPTADPEFLDHASFLEIVKAGADGMGFAVDESGLLERVATAPLLLAGSGLRLVGVRGPGAGLARLESRDGSTVIAVALAPGASPRELGLAAGRGEMERRIEQWLGGAGGQLADASNAIALIAHTNPDDAGMIDERVGDWNTRFAYPRIVTGKPDELLAILDRRGTPPRPYRPLAGGDRWQPSAFDAAARAARVFDPLVTRLGTTAGGLAVLAEQFAFRVPGTLVANSTPFTSTGVATMPDGSERVVTDVPALGYVCVPYPGVTDDRAGPAAPQWTPVPGSDNDLTLDGRHFEIRIDLETGAIRSLVTRAVTREWVRRGGGFNTAAGFRLDTLLKLQNPAVGTRLVVTRRSPEGASLTSTITVYDEMPWVDVTNEVTATTGPATYGFSVALEKPATSWEVPAGFDERPPGAVARLVHLRWLKLSAGSDSLFFRGLDAPVASVSADADIASLAPARARYRFGFASGFSAPEDPWRFGWGTEALLAAPVPGSGRATLPSFGSLLVTDQPGVCIVDLRRDTGGEGIVVYLQELTGVARDITVGPGVLSFRGARRVDFTGFDLGELPMLTGGGTSVPVRGYGMTAARLTGIELAGR